MNNERHEHKRVKHGQLPGDISKYSKILIRETKGPLKTPSSPYVLPAKATQSLRRELGKKAQAVLKERARKLISEGERDYREES